MINAATEPPPDPSAGREERPARRLPGGLAARARGGRGGFLAIEVVIVTLVLIVALQVFAEIMLATSRQRSVNRENSIAVEASRSAIEHLKSLPLSTVFALYNEDPADDPDGPGTAPGPRFVVPGLTPVEGSVDGTHGVLRFPVEAGAPGVLREDLVDRELGLPRDLDGDGLVDGADHAGDYTILPLELRIAWRGRVGRRELSQYVILTEMRR